MIYSQSKLSPTLQIEGRNDHSLETIKRNMKSQLTKTHNTTKTETAPQLNNRIMAITQNYNNRF